MLSPAAAKVLASLAASYRAAGGSSTLRANPPIEARTVDVAARLELPQHVTEAALQELAAHSALIRMNPGHFTLTPVGVALADQLDQLIPWPTG